MRRFLFLVFASTLFFTASQARADNAWDDERRNAAHDEGNGDTSVWEKRRLALNLNLGFGTPNGLAGVDFEVAPLPWWTIGVGGGTSLSGPQGSLSTRVRYAFGHSAVALGIGGSRGRLETGQALWDSSWTKVWSAAYWFNIEGSIEHRWSDGFQFRLYFGLATLLNPSDAQCNVDEYNGVRDCGGWLGGTVVNIGNSIPYMGLALGHAFEL